MKIDEKRIAELTAEARNVPFGNSQFQIKTLIANEGGPERTYRKCLLELDQRLGTLQNAKFNRDRAQVEIDRIELKLLATSLDPFEKRLLEIDLQEKKYCMAKTEKLIEDCMIEAVAFIEVLEHLPKFTREQFELAEHGYWSNRLIHEASVAQICAGAVNPGTAHELAKLGVAIKRDAKGLEFQVPQVQKLSVVESKEIKEAK